VNIIQQGIGVPLVLIPGLQGRWEYMRPTVDALSSFFRVITFTLCDERSSARAIDPKRGFDDYVAQVGDALDGANVERAVVCGVSFGGVVALRFAAAHPGRTIALVLASTPAPEFRLRRLHRVYARAPRIFGPLFLAGSPWRLRAEIVAALPDSRARWEFRRAMLRTLVSSPVSLSRMGSRARLMDGMDLRADCRRVADATLVVTGEPGLDHIVPVDGSSEYARLIPNARSIVLERTGHLGSMTRPRAFASAVTAFVESVSAEALTKAGRGALREGRQPDRVA
jgi:pimeloyl-ACP methyl ester carboxylesterase